ncbi:hypothetical protein [Pedobacter sp. V48]|uniref:hypothetical protein n=1 Tax=Pedobacter sp. V48 TaxID=509635 RepID=UPI0003E5680A|nr:hypothetical protein [Pedobacter sp. V48]ETZ20166.1 hypothetical protein N824_08105 [Pedobacter sp. V48]
MITISEIKQLPIFRTLYVVTLLSYSICPPVLILYYFDPKLFGSMDTIKLMLLLLSNGIMYLLVNFWVSVGSLVGRMNLEDNVKSTIFEDIAINASIYAFFVMSCAYGFGLVAIELEWATSIKSLCKFILAANGAVYLVSGFTLRKVKFIISERVLPRN